MNDELAERLLAEIMEWDPGEAANYLPEIQTLASLKYDEYEGYRPGVKFVESLSSWLRQFKLADRRSALEFVLNRMVFVSRAELDHLVTTAYSDTIRPHLLTRAAADLGQPSYRVAHIANSPAFHGLERRTLVLGLSDGARLDRLRRSSTLSHEQFHLVLDITADRTKKMLAKLKKALKAKGLDQPATFRQIVLVDDFYGSGLTLLRRDGAGWDGRLMAAEDQRRQLAAAGALSDDAEILVVVYILTHQARAHVQKAIGQAGLTGYELAPILQLTKETKLGAPKDSAILALSRGHYDPSVTDEHKSVGGGDAALGFASCQLPIVLYHNAPNNSISLLWADTMKLHPEKGQRALFPRHERHHADRP